MPHGAVGTIDSIMRQACRLRVTLIKGPQSRCCADRKSRLSYEDLTGGDLDPRAELAARVEHAPPRVDSAGLEIDGVGHARVRLEADRVAVGGRVNDQFAKLSRES